MLLRAGATLLSSEYNQYGDYEIYPTLSTALEHSVPVGTVMALLDSLPGGFDPEGYDECSTMYSACETGRVDIVRALLARGVRADGEHDRVGFMLEAKRSGHMKIVKLLKAAGARIN